MNDSPKNKGLRKKLVLELMKKGIKDEDFFTDEAR